MPRYVSSSSGWTGSNAPRGNADLLVYSKEPGGVAELGVTLAVAAVVTSSGPPGWVTPVKSTELVGRLEPNPHANHSSSPDRLKPIHQLFLQRPFPDADETGDTMKFSMSLLLAALEQCGAAGSGRMSEVPSRAAAMRHRDHRGWSLTR